MAARHVEAGRKGGKKTYLRYGKRHMSMIGRKGAEATHTRYKIEPLGTSNYLMRCRETYNIKAAW